MRIFALAAAAIFVLLTLPVASAGPEVEVGECRSWGLHVVAGPVDECIGGEPHTRIYHEEPCAGGGNAVWVLAVQIIRCYD